MRSYAAEKSLGVTYAIIGYARKETVMKKLLLMIISLLPMSTSAHSCTLGSTVLIEVANPGITYIRGNYGLEDVSFARFYKRGNIDPGVYSVYHPYQEDGYIEVSDGILVESRFGCYITWNYDIFVWRGYGGEMCSEDKYNPLSESCD